MSSIFSISPERCFTTPNGNLEGALLAGTGDPLVVVCADVSTWHNVVSIYDAHGIRGTHRIVASDDIQITGDGLFAVLDASDDADPCLRGYDLVNGGEMPHLRKIKGWPFRLSRGAPSRVAAADPESKRVTVYNVADGARWFDVPGPKRGWFAPATATDQLAVCDDPDQVFLQGVNARRKLGVLDAAFWLAWSSDDRFLAAQGLPDEVVVWRTESGAELARWNLGQGAYLSDVSATGRLVASFGPRHVDVWSAATGHRLVRIDSERDVAQARFIGPTRVAGLLSDGRAFAWTYEALGL